MTQRNDEDAVRAFWARVAPDYDLPAPRDVALAVLKNSPTTGVYRVTAGGVRAVVRWRRGSLVRVDEAAIRGAKAHLFAAEAGLAPRVLFWQPGPFELGGQPVIVSEYVASPPLDRAWFHDHLRQAATLLARLHRDADLTDALEAMDRGQARSDCLAAARGARALLEERLVALAAREWSPAVADVLNRLTAHLAWFGARIQPNRAAFAGQRVGPVHGDVQRGNWLAGPDGRVYLVDWDKAWLDDPALDVGMLLYWYVDPALWPVFLREYATGGDARPDVDALLIRARIRYPLHALSLCLWAIEELPRQEAEGGPADLDQALAFVDEFLPDLDRLRAGRLGG